MTAEIEHVLLGDQRFRVERRWGSLPDGVSLGLVSTLAVASDGAVYVSQRGGGAPVMVFESDGQYRSQWDIAGVTDPHGINIDKLDRVLLVDRDAHEVQIRSLSGQGLMTLGTRHYPSLQAPFNHPTSAIAASDGEIYVADGYGNSSVHRFDKNGNHMSSWGSPGNGDGELSTPHSIWIDHDDRVLVADRENDRVCVFDRVGNYITSWYGFYHPMDIAGDADGKIYISDQVPRVTQVDSHGSITGRCRPVWNVPHGLACGPNGAIHLIEMNPNSLVAITPV